MDDRCVRRGRRGSGSSTRDWRISCAFATERRSINPEELDNLRRTSAQRRASDQVDWPVSCSRRSQANRSSPRNSPGRPPGSCDRMCSTATTESGSHAWGMSAPRTRKNRRTSAFRASPCRIRFTSDRSLGGLTGTSEGTFAAGARRAWGMPCRAFSTRFVIWEERLTSDNLLPGDRIGRGPGGS